MKTIDITESTSDVNAILTEAGKEDIIVRTPDGKEFMITAVDDFDLEMASTRRNASLMALLDERAKEEETLSIEEVRRKLGIS